MNCHEIEMQLMEYVSGDLDAATYEKIEKHLGKCSACHLELEREKSLAEILSTLPVQKVAAPVAFIKPEQPFRFGLSENEVTFANIVGDLDIATLFHLVSMMESDEFEEVMGEFNIEGDL